MTIHRKFFFDSVRGALFGGAMTQDQVDGLNAHLDYADEMGFDDRQFAYVLATTYHETGRTFQPIPEIGKGAGKPYGVPDPVTGETYYGRGYVQLTWKENYQRQDTKLELGGTLVKEADRALEPDVAILILFEGMRDGDFTGVSLSDYFDEDTTDWVNARKIVNALDQAQTIAGYAQKFSAAITHVAEAISPRPPAPPKTFPLTITVPEPSTITITLTPES